MPPSNFVEAIGLAELDATHAGGQTPTHARKGDVLIAAIGCFDARNIDGAAATADVTIGGIVYHVENTAWTVLSRQVQGSDVAMLLSKIISDDEPAFWAFALTGASTKKLEGALMLYREIDQAAAVVEAGSAAVAASTVWNAPSRTLVDYSDLYLGIHYCRSAAVVITPSGSYTQRYHKEDTNSSILIGDWHPEATGASGAKNASTGAAQSGIVASFLLQAMPATEPPALSNDGGIGFWGKTPLSG